MKDSDIGWFSICSFESEILEEIATGSVAKDFESSALFCHFVGIVAFFGHLWVQFGYLVHSINDKLTEGSFGQVHFIIQPVTFEEFFYFRVAQSLNALFSSHSFRLSSFNYCRLYLFFLQILLPSWSA